MTGVKPPEESLSGTLSSGYKILVVIAAADVRVLNGAGQIEHGQEREHVRLHE